MLLKNLLLTFTLLLLIAPFNYAYKIILQDSSYKRCFVGSTFFMLGNFSKVNKPDFAQVNLGYRLTQKDAISLELKTWKYAWSLGIPYGSSFQNPQEEFPGFIREAGFAIAYQRFLYKKFYAAVHVMGAWQKFHDATNTKIGLGFQVFNTYRLGYQLQLFKNRVFIEPSLAITHRPYQSKMPNSFEVNNNKWPSYFLGEPGLHFGFNF